MAQNVCLLNTLKGGDTFVRADAGYMVLTNMPWMAKAVRCARLDNGVLVEMEGTASVVQTEGTYNIKKGK